MLLFEIVQNFNFKQVLMKKVCFFLVALFMIMKQKDKKMLFEIFIWLKEDEDH